MTTQLELWSGGWESEPCGGSEPDPDAQAHLDLQARRTQTAPVRLVTTDHGRPAGRPFPWGRPFIDITTQGDLL